MWFTKQVLLNRYIYISVIFSPTFYIPSKTYFLWTFSFLNNIYNFFTSILLHKKRSKSISLYHGIYTIQSYISCSFIIWYRGTYSGRWHTILHLTSPLFFNYSKQNKLYSFALVYYLTLHLMPSYFIIQGYIFWILAFNSILNILSIS